jgi:hypothetical protein
MKPGDLVQLEDTTTAWRSCNLFVLQSMGMLDVDDVVMLLGVKHKRWMYVLTKYGLCYLYSSTGFSRETR